MQKSFVLSSDYNYIVQIETTIKSILYNHTNVLIYIINTDIPQAWFRGTNQLLKDHYSQIIDVKINPNSLKNLRTSFNHISNISWGRLMIPQLINDNRILYLDSDIVVDDNLDELFTINLGEYPIGAVREFFQKNATDNFNTGVLLIDNRQLKEHQFSSESLLSYGTTQLDNGDQTVLNNYFKSYYHLNGCYNFQVGFDTFYYRTFNMDKEKKNYLNTINQIEYPKIIHYLSKTKPWEFSYNGRLCDKWWYYRMMDFSTAINHNPRKTSGNIFIMTNSQDVAHLEILAQQLSDFTFHIAAWTPMGWNLTKLQKHLNIRLYPIVTPPVINELIQKADCYLDINYGSKLTDTINEFTKTSRPIFAFHDTKSDDIVYPNYHIFDPNNITGMVNAIKHLPKH